MANLGGWARVAATALAIGQLSAAAAPAAAPTVTVLHIASHLPKAAKVSLDGGRPVSAPAYGSTLLPVPAGRHVLTVTTPGGVTYKADLDLTPDALLVWRHKGYWCVNLLKDSLERYSPKDCAEDVED